MVRVIALAHALARARRGVVLKRFAEQHGWPIRYVHRDLKTLEAAGYPVQGERGRYWLPPDSAPKVVMEVDREELLALFLARQLAAPLRGTAMGRALDRLWAKLGDGGGQARLVPSGESAVAVRPPAIDYAAHRSHIAALERAIERREAVSVRYRRPRTGEITERLIEPGEIYVDPGLESMYCIAWCRLRGAVRVFAVHRFLEVRSTGEPAPRRSETRSRVALRKAFRVWRADSSEHVKLEVSPELAGEIAERRWHPTQTLEPTVGGGAILTMDVADATELERWLLGFGPDVTVLEPVWLRERIREQHARAAGNMGAPRRSAPARRRSQVDRRRGRTQ